MNFLRGAVGALTDKSCLRGDMKMALQMNLGFLLGAAFGNRTLFHVQCRMHYFTTCAASW